MRKTTVFIFICLFCLKNHNTQAQEKSVSFSGYLDTYYAYDFSEPFNNQRLYVTQYDRHNEFNLNHAWIKGNYSSEKVRANLAMQIGTYPANNYGAEPEKLYQMIYEANAGYKVTKNGWLDVGVFGGHFGYESALGMERALYTPALATEYTPYYQSGVRYTHDISDKTQVRLVVLNGWQNIGETNNKKSVGMAIDHQLTDQLLLSYGNYFGDESTVEDEEENRMHHNFLAEFTPTDQLTFAGIFDFTSQKSTITDRRTTTTFITFISEYRLSEKWSAAGRYEYVKDQDQLLINSVIGQLKMNVFSLALTYAPETNVAFKLESKIYADEDNNFSGTKGFGERTLLLHGGLMVKIN